MMCGVMVWGLEMAGNMSYRTGIGYDIHRLVAGRRLVLGGVEIPGEYGLAGHSDADVVLHALCDAMLGAAGLSDIGEHFPDTDPNFKDVDSRRFVTEVLRLLTARGYEIGNVDLIIHAQRPRLGGHKSHIKQTIAVMLGLPEEMVSVKATTNEGLDAIGRGEAVASWATVLLRKAF
ncbi:MAG: 2-C-methyl-D-erythritol 2,4-cyclodiphosphate synthase [Planctomycetota bacterium]